MVLLFIHQLPHQHPDLHSFPTRRSSDLGRSAIASAWAAWSTPAAPARSAERDSSRAASRGTWAPTTPPMSTRSEEHTSELQSRGHLVCRLLLDKKNKLTQSRHSYFYCFI